MEILNDSSGQSYIEIPMESGFVRVTLIPSGWTESDAVRISIKDENGHLRQGPEIPVEQVGELVNATIELIPRVR